MKSYSNKMIEKLSAAYLKAGICLPEHVRDIAQEVIDHYESQPLLYREPLELKKIGKLEWSYGPFIIGKSKGFCPGKWHARLEGIDYYKNYMRTQKEAKTAAEKHLDGLLESLGVKAVKWADKEAEK